MEPQGKKRKVKREKKTRKTLRFSLRMKRKLSVLFFVIMALLAVAVARLGYINLHSGEKYGKIVLNQLGYRSTTIPFRRGDIADRKGTVLASSTNVYNVVLDCSIINSNENYLDPTIELLYECFEPDIEEAELRAFIKENPDDQYHVLQEEVSAEAVEHYEERAEEIKEERKAYNKEHSKDADTETLVTNVIGGIWFEKDYIRVYPYKTLASSVLGFASSANVGMAGLESYYNDTLNGTDGREYGYLNTETDYETTVEEAEDGETLVTTIDVNLQSIVEEKIDEFNAAMSGNAAESGDAGEDSSIKGEGAKHIGVIIMDPNNGEVLAMACSPDYDLTSPYDLEYRYTDEEIATFKENDEKDEEELGKDDMTTSDALNEIWQNFCVTYTYEPGSVAKCFTVAAGLETGTLTGNETYYCDGGETISGITVRCVSRSGHGLETVQDALSDSCNDSLMQMSYSIGAHNFSKYQQIFNFGLKTNVDLPDETRTDTLIYHEDEMTSLNLAINAFGQSFNVSMIQMISAYSSVVNGGSYYLPHLVGSIEDAEGNTVEKISPTLLRRTVSEETSDTILSYLEAVVAEGTGSVAKVDGYSMGGKTGTAEKIPRGQGNYLVSFIGHVPADDPELVIYVVVDEPNSEDQAHSYYAQSIAREILEEALPYLNIYPDEELTGVNVYKDIKGDDVEGAEESGDSDDWDVSAEEQGGLPDEAAGEDYTDEESYGDDDYDYDEDNYDYEDDSDYEEDDSDYEEDYEEDDYDYEDDYDDDEDLGDG